MKRLLVLLWLLPLILIWTVGCKSTLAPGGAYSGVTPGGITNSAPDMLLFQADSAYQIAYQVIDAVFTIEKNNRAFLWSLSPKIKTTLDGIRPQAVEANAKYLTARDLYLANPVPANLTALNTALAEIQRLATAAQSALPSNTTLPKGP